MLLSSFRQSKEGLASIFADAKKHQNHLHTELPYRKYDFTEGFFENKGSRGFGLRLSVLGGANDQLIVSLNRLVMTLPQGKKWDYQLQLMGHNRVGHYIEANKEKMAERGGVLAEMAERDAKYAHYAAQHGYFHNQKNTHFDLRDYDAYFFVSTTSSNLEALRDVRCEIETALVQLGFDFMAVAPEDLLTHVGDIMNFNPKQDRPLVRDYNPLDSLHLQAMSPDTECLFRRDHLAIRHTAQNGQDVHGRVVSMGLSKLPKDFRLYGLPECFTSIRNISRSLICPHMLTLNFRCEPTGKEEAANNSKINDLTKTVESKMVIFAPTAKEELSERKEIQTGMNAKEFCITSMALTLTLFTSEAKQRQDVQAASTAFEGAGLSIIKMNMLQSQSLLSVLPFMMSDGFWSDAVKAGRVRKVKSSNLVNFFPLVLDFKRLRPGILLPTMRQQISFFDPFTCGSDNQNIALTGGSGAGKSFLVQEIARGTYAMGGKVWILDKGSSYKKLTLMLGGTYMTHKNIFLNPFTHLGKIEQGGVFQDDDGSEVNPMAEALDNITALFATIASPYEPLTSYQQNILGDAIVAAWDKHKTKTLVDNVQEELYTRYKEFNDTRIRDIAVQLDKYCVNGIHGELFNKPSLLDPDVHFTTLELDGFAPGVLRSVIFALIVTINQQMYLSGTRSMPKMCIIEEAWSLLSGSNKQAQEFINTGYRTARKFGGSFCTVTQGIDDFFANEEAKACYNNSDIHVVMRQGEGFDKYLMENPNAFSPLEKELIKRFDKSSIAGYSCLRIKAGGHVSWHRFFADPIKRAMYSTEPNEYEYCENLVNLGVPLMEAIDRTSMHFYGDEIREFESHIT
ncbi:type IV secretion system protein TraC [Vibrio coralliilyticus]|uniref:type IV secretion system protein TraC n=1 Tax=Vibrio TaxID=662 RepID=UPI00050381C7|nr:MULTISPECIES: type IV secretion system protein TraC [Vibrio]KFI12060.1 conjugal transfer protein TraC [Vibrio sp. B183]NOI21191.1 type IV secretion system protein TraC [Vibrio coralliilyticus]